MSKRTLIVGATSAIAEAVARRYAAEGASLFLAARNTEHAAVIADDLRVRGAAVVTVGAYDAANPDIADALVAAAWDALGGIDIALIAHGSLPDQPACAASATLTRREMEINALSVIDLLVPLANRMESARTGTLAVIGSVAGDRGRQSNYVYGAAKGCLDIFLQGLAHRLTRTRVQVLIVKPGFVDTPMTAAFPKGPLWASPEVVARDIQRAIARGARVLYTPWFWRWIMLAIRSAPTAVFHRTRL
jgi:decaprenylphospho-beta-D-erythro-pentofuranosid-2-ulose 2-reductase